MTGVQAELQEPGSQLLMLSTLLGSPFLLGNWRGKYVHDSMRM